MASIDGTARICHAHAHAHRILLPCCRLLVTKTVDEYNKVIRRLSLTDAFSHGLQCIYRHVILVRSFAPNECICGG